MKNNKNGISVIIPTFNRAKYLYPTLICFCNQKEITCEYEIIVVDSGEDESEKIIQLIQKSFNIRIIYKKIKKCKNRSLIRNEGAKLSKYDILCFLDNDILVPPDFLKRHWEEHQKLNKLVLMQCRRSLTQFDLNKIGEETLLNNFYLLERLPWYKDERLDTYENKDQWRFVFSHTMSLKKNDFLSAGKFNKKFGDHWGFEDLELGLNLMQKRCNFKLINDSFVYHQPHFVQSNKEQNETRFNKDLFVKLHNSYEIELYLAFYTDYTIFLQDIYRHKDLYLLENPTKQEIIKFNRILGCIYSCSEKPMSKKLQLGVYVPVNNQNCRKTLILPTFFSFPKLVQYSIISEAFRVSKNLYFRILSEESMKYLIKIARDCGFVVDILSEKKYSKCYVKNKCYSKFFTMVLPEIYSPEKRYVYSWLLKELKMSGKELIISDFHNIKTLKNDDLRISDSESLILDKCCKNYLGLVKFQIINSAAIFNSQSRMCISDTIENNVIHDDDFYCNCDSLKYRGVRKCRHYSEKDFADLTLASIYEISNIITGKNKSEESLFIAFMENGFFEDGVDLVLDFIAKMRKRNSSVRLIIKLPYYDRLLKNCLPYHNEASKYNKLFQIYQKYQSDESLLKSYLFKYNLFENVNIISENITMESIIEIIQKSEFILHFSRGVYTPPQIYIAILLGKNVVLGEHHIIPDELNNYVIKIHSKKFDFADELKIPVSCMNSVYSAYRCYSEDLLSFLDKKNFDKEKLHKIYKKIYKKVKSAFVES